jgi:hypothetical protein
MLGITLWEHRKNLAQRAGSGQSITKRIGGAVQAV